jgi:hypothetical protein
MMKWTVNLFANVLVTMVAIYVIKKVSQKYEIPVLNTITKEV